MSQNEQTSITKGDVLSFITPDNLECCICAHIRDEFAKKFPNYHLSVVEDNTFFCYIEKYKLCKITVNIDKSINIGYNSNVYIIKNLSDITEFVNYFEKYAKKLQELYTYLKKNYHLVYKNDMSTIYIYGKTECETSCCSIEPTRRRKYYFSCDANCFFLYENHIVIRSFKTIDEIDSFQQLQDYKNTCGFCC